MLKSLEKVYAVIALFFMTGSLMTVMSPNELATGLDEVGSPYYRMLGLGIGMVAVTLLASRPKAALRYWIVFIPVLFAVASIAWSVSPGLSFRRSGSLILTTIFAIWLSDRFSTRTLMNLLIAAMAIVCISSFIAIFALPELGVHNPSNTTNPAHYGAWRGMKGHKNDFGRLVALAFNIFLVAFLTRTRWRWAYLAGCLSALFLIGGSRSGQAVVLAILPPVALVMFLWVRGMSLQIRSLVILVSLPIGLFFYLISNIIVTEVLNILGKDPTLTGRSDIWNAILSSLGHHILLGGGYGAGWNVVAEGVLLRIGGTMTHAHNGYLDLLLDIGIVGVSITLAFYATIIIKVKRQLLTSGRTEIIALGLVAMIFLIAGNWVASFLLSYNSIQWVLPVLLYVKLTRHEPAIEHDMLTLETHTSFRASRAGH